MVSRLVEECVAEISTVKSLIAVSEKLRAMLGGHWDAAAQAVVQHPLVADVLTNVPQPADWKVFEHCATLTRLYAIFERCVSRVVRAWLAELPLNSEKYESLGATFQGIHRRGVARVLLDLDKDRFSHLKVDGVLSGFMDAVNGKTPYSVLPEAFLFDNRSLKRERLDELFAQVRLKGGWAWVGNHRFVTGFIKQVRGGGNTPEAELRTFVNYRNDAAHGNVDQVLASGPLAEYADFMISVCRAIGELVLWNRTDCRRNLGLLAEVGKVTERFSNNVVVATVADCTLRVGMEMICFGDTYCHTALIESIQLDGGIQREVVIERETAVGLRLNVRTQKHPRLLVERALMQVRR